MSTNHVTLPARRDRAIDRRAEIEDKIAFLETNRATCERRLFAMEIGTVSDLRREMQRELRAQLRLYDFLIERRRADLDYIARPSDP